MTKKQHIMMLLLTLVALTFFTAGLWTGEKKKAEVDKEFYLEYISYCECSIPLEITEDTISYSTVDSPSDYIQVGEYRNITDFPHPYQE